MAPKPTPPPAVPARPTVAPANARAGQGQPQAQTARPSSANRIKVRATKVGYYDNARRRIDDVFTIDGTIDERETLEVNTDPPTTKRNPNYGQPLEFSAKWMERVDPSTPEKITTGREALRQHHDETLGARVARPAGSSSSETPTGSAGVLGDEDERE